MTHVLNSVPVLKTSRASTARKRRRLREREEYPNIIREIRNELDLLLERNKY